MVVRISYSPGRSLGKWSGFLKILSKAGGKNQYEPFSVLVEWSGKSFWKEKNIKKGGGGCLPGALHFSRTSISLLNSVSEEWRHGLIHPRHPDTKGMLSIIGSINNAIRDGGLIQLPVKPV